MQVVLADVVLDFPQTGEIKCTPTSTWMPRLMKGKQPYTYAHLAGAKTD